MKTVKNGTIITVPSGWGVFCHKCHELIESGTECFQEDTVWLNLYHMWCRPRAKVEQAAAERQRRVSRRRMERAPA